MNYSENLGQLLKENELKIQEPSVFYIFSKISKYRKWRKSEKLLNNVLSIRRESHLNSLVQFLVWYSIKLGAAHYAGWIMQVSTFVACFFSGVVFVNRPSISFVLFLSFLLVELTEGSDDLEIDFLLSLDGQMLPACHPRYLL